MVVGAVSSQTEEEESEDRKAEAQAG